MATTQGRLEGRGARCQPSGITGRHVSQGAWLHPKFASFALHSPELSCSAAAPDSGAQSSALTAAACCEPVASGRYKSTYTCMHVSSDVY